ncbi:hypothetical protein [Providencia phage PSTCR5]|uniref:Uncharacterized protein n=1 Tax=Providencia phage PSTCR5 TaxID=2783547 RepID=A0A873WI02_9CAUD|nr:hypothetical protein KNV68_gp135 [Providencia phage PSTCR5]QPB12223.1 hypothetical protein [Providencia phage PSTCR5]
MKDVIPKSDLVVGGIYKGTSRNSTIAIWKGKCFSQERNKFGHTYTQDINHPEDFNGFDVFTPYEFLGMQ